MTSILQNIAPSELEDLYWNDGLSLKQLGNKFIVDDDTVRRYMIKFGIPRRSLSEALNGKPKSKEHRMKLSKIRRQPHFIQNSIANLPKDVSGVNNPMYGRHHSQKTIEKIRKHRAAVAKRKLDGELTEQLANLYWEEEYPLHKIAKIYDVSYGCVYKTFVRRKIKMRNLKDILIKRSEEKRKLRHIPKEVFKQLYFDQKKSLSEIANQFDVTFATIRREFIKRCISRRSRLQAVPRGSKHPCWRGGSIYYYGPNWYPQRKKVLKRDKHICQVCGATEINKTHDVHHLISFKHFSIKKYVQANKLSNLITLCHNCHLVVERGALTLNGINI